MILSLYNYYILPRIPVHYHRYRNISYCYVFFFQIILLRFKFLKYYMMNTIPNLFHVRPFSRKVRFSNSKPYIILLFIFIVYYTRKTKSNSRLTTKRNSYLLQYKLYVYGRYYCVLSPVFASYNFDNSTYQNRQQ